MPINPLEPNTTSPANWYAPPEALTQQPLEPTRGEWGTGLAGSEPTFSENLYRGLSLGPRYLAQEQLNKTPDEKMADMAKMAAQFTPTGRITSNVMMDILRKDLQGKLVKGLKDSIFNKYGMSYRELIDAYKAGKLPREVEQAFIEEVPHIQGMWRAVREAPQEWLDHIKDVVTKPQLTKGATRGLFYPNTMTAELATDPFGGGLFGRSTTHEIFGHGLDYSLSLHPWFKNDPKLLETWKGVRQKGASMNRAIWRLKELADEADSNGLSNLAMRINGLTRKIYENSPAEILSMTIPKYLAAGHSLEEASRKALEMAKKQADIVSKLPEFSEMGMAQAYAKFQDELSSKIPKKQQAMNYLNNLLPGPLEEAGMSPRDIASKLGVRYDAAMDYSKLGPKFGKMHQITDPRTGSSIWVKEPITEQSMLEKIKESRKGFGIVE